MQSRSYNDKSSAAGSGLITVVYDGECPFCTAYSRATELQERFGVLLLIDVRASPEWKDRIDRAGLDINEGFVVEHDGRLFHGAEALAFLSQRTKRNKIFGALSGFTLSNPKVAKAVYPILRAGRNLSLKVLGRSKIGRGIL